MRVSFCAVALLSILATAPVYGQEDKAKDWCTDAHMAEMDTQISKLSDADKKKTAMMHLDMSKAAMKNKDMEGCVKHMEEAHSAMGL
jgi:hypothetical protein